jgi:hypothetical protein
MAKLNLDKVRAEQGLEAHELEVDGKVYMLPPVVPINFITALVSAQKDTEKVGVAIEVLFGEAASEAGNHIGFDDLNLIATELYGASLGESEASETPSKTTGPKSRPTSSGSTAST